MRAGYTYGEAFYEVNASILGQKPLRIMRYYAMATRDRQFFNIGEEKAITEYVSIMDIGEEKSITLCKDYGR